MTKNFKKTKNFDTMHFVNDFEREILEEEEGDIFTTPGIASARDADQISDIEEGFMTGYLEA